MRRIKLTATQREVLVAAILSACGASNLEETYVDVFESLHTEKMECKDRVKYDIALHELLLIQSKARKGA